MPRCVKQANGIDEAVLLPMPSIIFARLWMMSPFAIAVISNGKVDPRDGVFYRYKSRSDFNITLFATSDDVERVSSDLIRCLTSFTIWLHSLARRPWN